MTSSLWNRVRMARADGRLMGVAMSWLRASSAVISNPAAERVRIHAPAYVAPDPADRPLVERIFRAYARMKRDQKTAPPAYLPSTLWQEHLDVAYRHLNEGLSRDDVDHFHYFLANFGSWHEYTGVTWSPLVQGATGSVVKQRHLENEVFLRQTRLWEWFHSERKSTQSLEHPLHGNQCGAFVDGVFTTISSFPAQVYTEMLAGVLEPTPRPVVAELGAGYGAFSYYLLRELGAFSYVDFDLPETLCLAAFFLSKSFPGKKVLLYGEAPYGAEAHAEYDMIFMPNYAIESAGADSVDLFLNTFSLGEMNTPTAVRYLEEISRVAKHFFHVNHDRIPNQYGDGDRGLLGWEYPIPADRFRLMFRYPDLFHMTNRGFLNLASDTFAYLYQRNARGQATSSQAL